MQQSEVEAQQGYFIASRTIVTIPLQEPPPNGHFQEVPAPRIYQELPGSFLMVLFDTMDN